LEITRMGMRQISIIGGGPSGAMCGERLARAGYEVTLYDERLAWEKPCGGGLTHRASATYPFLLNGPYPKKIVHKMELISSTAHRARMNLDHPIVIYSRTVLNGLLLDRAAAAGCHVVRARVTKIDTSGKRVRLQVGEQVQETDFAVIAAGARNSLLPGTPRLEPSELEITLGYFIPSDGDIIRIKFLRRFEGYIWSFPRTDHLSVGICGSMAKHTSQELRGFLDQFVLEEGHSSAGARFYSHVLPSPQMPTLQQRPIAGQNWAMVGDAGALVDPITGEGLYYALRSGELLAKALIAGQPEQYPARVRADFSGDLEFAIGIARYVYRGRFLGAAVTTRMIQFIERSSTFRTLMADLFSGAQEYGGLKRRIWTQFGMSLSEVLASLFRPGTSLDQLPAGDANTPL
jgi:flavin-dependent dehydrogenase